MYGNLRCKASYQFVKSRSHEMFLKASATMGNTYQRESCFKPVHIKCFSYFSCFCLSSRDFDVAMRSVIESRLEAPDVFKRDHKKT